jgi:anthranilate synthase/aminodeoxychorismate synthase-like glutamine amidotransferase
VCLGHQCIGALYGAEVVRAPVLMHGKTSPIYHRKEGVFSELPVPFDATRYHSLVVDRESVPSVLQITAETTDGLVMGLRHRELDVEGVQFHPESILTGVGMRLLGTWLARCDAALRV